MALRSYSDRHAPPPGVPVAACHDGMENRAANRTKVMVDFWYLPGRVAYPAW